MSNCVHEHIRLPPKWIALNINKRECGVYIPIPGHESVCQCGRRKIDHGDFIQYAPRGGKWSPVTHTRTFPTDAYGSIVFEGGHHPNRAHYARLSFDTNPEQVVNMMRYVWNIPMPRLIISVHGGSLNFDLSSRLGTVFQNGIIKVAQTTSAWLISNGLNSGVSKHLGNAVGNRWSVGSVHKYDQFVSVGIAPWGMCEHRGELIGRGKDRVYSPLKVHNSSMIHLNPRHSNFLLVDNGSIGRFGGEMYFRRRLEKCVSSCPVKEHGACTTPLVAIIMEGSGHTLRLITEYLYDEPKPVPVILFTGTGRLTDFLAWLLKTLKSTEELRSSVDNVIRKIQKIFSLDEQASLEVFHELELVFEKRSLITVYNGYSASERDFDTVILTSVFLSNQWLPVELLELSLLWDRVDLARKHIFVYGREWNPVHLDQTMMEALISSRLDFIDLLLEHGFNMKSFLTVKKLEKLYSTLENGKTLDTLLMEILHLRGASSNRENVHKISGKPVTLADIGAVLVQMGVYRAEYFHARILPSNPQPPCDSDTEKRFAQPMDDLFLWAVLTRRHVLARHLWILGHGALAKSLIAAMLNKFMAEQISKTNISFVKEFTDYVEEWKKLSLALLDSCYREDVSMTRQLLTMELKNWPHQTCLNLAVQADHKTFFGHPCCQILLSDLWLGAFNLKYYSSLKVFLATIFPLFALCLEYKSKEELKLFPRSDLETYCNGYEEAVFKTELENYQENESVRTFYHECDISAMNVLKNLRNRFKSGRKTDLSHVVSKLDFGKESQSTDRTKLVQAPVTKGDESSVIVTDGDKKERTGAGSCINGAQNKEHDMGFNNEFSRFVTREQSLTPCQKLIESQKAPITKFMRHFIGYLVFIGCLWYVILFNQNPDAVGIVEGYVMLFVITQGMELIRMFITIDALTFGKKVLEMKSSVWKMADLAFVSLSTCGVILRFTGFFKYAMLTYQVTSIYWNLRIYKFLGAHRFIGPKLLMIKRMFWHMIYFALIIVVMIFTFAIAKQAIRTPNKDPTMDDLIQTFIEAYVMMFGEVAVLEDSINVQCIDDFFGKSEECPIGSLFIPVFWVVYMMLSNVLVFNVLIAVFNGIYAEINTNSIEIWMSQQFLVVVEFVKKPLLPPPFIFICHIVSVLKAIFIKLNRCLCHGKLHEKTDDEALMYVLLGNDNINNLKAHLSPEEQDTVFDFEEENVNLLRHVLTSDKGASFIGFAEAVYRVEMTSEKSPTIEQVKNSLQELYTEMEIQGQLMDRLKDCWETRIAQPKGNNNAARQVEDELLSSSDDSEMP